jgi:hypothetical protein
MTASLLRWNLKEARFVALYTPDVSVELILPPNHGAAVAAAEAIISGLRNGIRRFDDVIGLNRVTVTPPYEVVCRSGVCEIRTTVENFVGVLCDIMTIVRLPPWCPGVMHMGVSNGTNSYADGEWKHSPAHHSAVVGRPDRDLGAYLVIHEGKDSLITLSDKGIQIKTEDSAVWRVVAEVDIPESAIYAVNGRGTMVYVAMPERLLMCHVQSGKCYTFPHPIKVPEHIWVDGNVVIVTAPRLAAWGCMWGNPSRGGIWAKLERAPTTRKARVWYEPKN